MSVEIDVDVSEAEAFLADFAPELDAVLEEEIPAFMDEAVELARADAPVKTGFLRATVFWECVGDEWHLIAGAGYAVYQEFGTRWIRAKLFLTHAWEMVQASLDSFVDKVLGRLSVE